MTEPQTALPHSLALNERRELSVTGVKKVIYYDDTGARLEIEQGILTIAGQGLQMGELSTQSGRLTLSGLVEELQYSQKSPLKSGLFGRRRP